MTPGAMLRTALAISAAGFLGLLGYSAVQAIDYAEEQVYSRDLRRIQAVTAQLNERVLMSRSALMTHYDPLVRALLDLRTLFERLQRVPRFLGRAAAADLRAKLQKGETELRQKDELIETFKTNNSVLQNSLHYFPILANSVIDRARAAPAGSVVASRIQALISAIMLFDTSADAESTARVRAAQVDLSGALQTARELELGREVELILAHSHIILERKPIADATVQQILAVPLPRAALELEEAYSMHYRVAIDRALLLRQILFGLALSTVVLGLTDVILRMRRAALALQNATGELRRANAALAREREKERELGELKTRFVSMTSHEFRTPLSVIVSSTDLLENYSERWDAERRRDHLERIRSAAGSMDRLLDDILLIGRAEAGVLRASPAQLNLDEVCRQLVESLEYSSARSHDIRYDFSGDPNVTLDERLLSELVGNLLSNALKYSPPGSQVDFDVVASDQQCRFTVEDRGIGIPQEDVAHLFESFFRASNADQIKGSGLGLAVVKKAVEVQNGTVEVESRLGQGTKFVVHVPRELPLSRTSSSEL
ncbi:MAG TPA: DAHL domain-containing protein [Polyangiaceae bacterium]|nr:DAHL domain-containing protein [Polyangiaceae bacterium]